MTTGLLSLTTLLACVSLDDLLQEPVVSEVDSPASPGLLLLTLEDAPATRFTPWGGTDDRLQPFADLGTTWLRAYAPTPQLQPNLATLWTGRSPEQHGVWLDGMQRLPNHSRSVFEDLTDAGWRTSSSTGTLLTTDRWGLHHGIKSQSVHDDTAPNPLDATVVADRLDVVHEAQAAWVHLAADGLNVAPDLVATWVDAHPEGWVVVVGVHGRGDGLELDDDGLRMPLIVVGPGFEPGETLDEVVGLQDIAASVRGWVGLEPGGPTLEDGGSDAVTHATHLGRALFGTGVLRGSTEPDGRVVIGEQSRWYGALGTRVPESGHIVPTDHAAIQRHLARHQGRPEALAPAALLPLVERIRLAHVAPYTLGDPDAAEGSTDPVFARGRLAFLDAVRPALRWKRFRELLRSAEEMGDTPAAHLLHAIGARGQANADDAAAALEAGHAAATGPMFAWHRSEMALDRCRIDDATSWFDVAASATPLPPPELSTALHRATAYGPLNPTLADHRDALVAAWPDDPYVRTLVDPRAITLLPVRQTSPVTGLIRARADWSQGHATKAMEDLQAAVAIDPMDCTLRVELARWYLESEDRFPANRLLAPLVRATPGDPVLDALWERAQVTPEERHERAVDRTWNRP